MRIKFTYLTILVCMYHLNASSQYSIPFQKTIGGSSADFLSCVRPTRDGGLITGGTSYSDRSYEKSQDQRGNGDYWIVKTDARGRVQWDRTIGGSGNDNLKSVIQTSDGGYALIGESQSNISFEKTENSRGSSDFWLVKLDEKGNIQWDRTLGGSGTEFIDNIVETDDGGFYLAGSSDSNKSGEKSENSRGAVDYWIIRLNKYGRKIWDKTVGGSDYDWCSPVALANDGGIIVGGFSSSNISGEKTENSRGGTDYWFVKLDKKGNLLWDKTVGGDGNEFCHGLIQTEDGGYVLGGSSQSGISGEKTGYNRGGVDYWAIKLDRNRRILWDKTIGGNSDDWCNMMIRSQTGNFIMMGGSLSTASGERSEYSRGGADYWVVSLASNGQLAWEKTIGGISDDWGNAIAEWSKNKFILGGSSNSSQSGDKTDFNRGDDDYWIVNLNYNSHTNSFDSTGLNGNNLFTQKGIQLNTLSVYPNPFSNSVIISINIPLSQKLSIVIYDLNGRFIRSLANEEMQAGLHQFTWNGSDANGNLMSAGIYIAAMTSPVQTKTLRIVLLK